MNRAGAGPDIDGHPWLAEVHAGSRGALLRLTPAGQTALRRHGRQSLLDALRRHLGEPALDTAYVLRLLDVHAGPTGFDPQTIDRWLQTPRLDLPITLGEHAQDGRWMLQLQLPLELVHFDDHFQQAPVLPGVLQVGWALALAAPRLSISAQCREMEALKFQHLLRPGDRVALSLRMEVDAADNAHGKLYFAYHLDAAHCSSGRLRVERTHD